LNGTVQPDSADVPLRIYSLTHSLGFLDAFQRLNSSLVTGL